MTAALALPLRSAPSRSALQMANPHFRRGYEDTWAQRSPRGDAMWLPDEQRAYERGLRFATWLKARGHDHIPLARGFLANPRAECLLIVCDYLGHLDIEP